MKATLLAAFAALSIASAASAADRVVAQLEAPVSAQKKIVAGGSIWNCEGSTCFATVQTSGATSVRACQALAKEVGRLSAFGGQRAFEADRLGKCNTAAATPATSSTMTAAN